MRGGKGSIPDSRVNSHRKKLNKCRFKTKKTSKEQKYIKEKKTNKKKNKFNPKKFSLYKEKRHVNNFFKIFSSSTSFVVLDLEAAIHRFSGK